MIVSKVFESVILDKYKPLLETTPNQFGFKPKHGTELAVFTLKQVVEFYRSNSSTLYVCYLDLSKAFDRIDHLSSFLKNSKPGICHWSLFVYYSTGISSKSSLLDGLHVFLNHFVYQMGYGKEEYFHLPFSMYLWMS